MRLRDIEEKLASIAHQRWGEDAQILVRLERNNGLLVIELPDGAELVATVSESGALLTQAAALLARHLERPEPWTYDKDSPNRDRRVTE